MATHLFFLGDIFDFWVGDHQFFYERFRPIVEAVRNIRKQGVQIEYFEGNHDLHLNRFWQKFDIPVWTEERYLQLHGLVVRLEHGDLINKEDINYLRFRKLVRHSSIEKLACSLPGRGLQAIGSFLSRKSRVRSSAYRNDQESQLREMIRNHAVRTYSENPFDVIISGHMHVRDDFKFKIAGKDIRSLNLGSWFEQQKALLIEGSSAEPAKLATSTAELPKATTWTAEQPRAATWKIDWVDLSELSIKNGVRKPTPPENPRG